MSTQIKIPCLGRPFSLGMLYDAHSDSIIPGKSLWDATILRSASNVTPQPSSNFDIIAEDSLEKKTSNLGIEANLKLSLLSGMVKVSGAAKFLDDKKSSNQQARVSLKYSSTTHFEQLTMDQLGAIQYPQVLDDNHATHVVTGILYGSDAFFVFDSFINNDEKIRDVCGNMEAKIKLIPVQGAGSVHVSEEEAGKKDKFQCKFYGDVILPSNPSTFNEAVMVYKDLPHLFESKSVPKFVYLYPLADLNDKPRLMVRWITSDLIAQTEEILEGFHKVEMKANDMMQHEICYKFPEIENQISSFQTLVKRFQMKFMSDVALLLPKIRSLGVDEAELAKLISSQCESPFNAKSLEKFLQVKYKREIEQLAQYVKNVCKHEKVLSAFPNDKCSLTALTTDDQIEHVICLAFNVTSEESPFIKMLEQYLRSSDSTDAKQIKKEWYETASISQALRLKCSKFSEYVDVLISSEGKSPNTIPVVSDRNEDIDCTGPAIVHYNQGFPAEFEPPSKPRNIAADNITPNSMTITWDKPMVGLESILSYKVQYYSEPTEVFTATTNGSLTTVQIGDLQPNTTYKLTVQAVANPNICEKSDVVIVQTAQRARMAEKILQQSKKMPGGSIPSVYALPLITSNSC